MASNRISGPLQGAFIAIFAAAIGAGGTLAGNAIASANAHDQLVAQFANDDRVRHHESLRDAYTKFISATSQAEMDVIRVVVHDTQVHRNTTGTEFKELFGDAAQLQFLSADVQVVGSRKAADLAFAVSGYFKDIIGTDHSTDELFSMASAMEPRLQRLVNVAQDELND